MKDKDSIKGRKLPDVRELYDVEGKNGVHFWSYAYMEIMNELYLGLNYYLADEQCFMVDMLNNGHGHIRPVEFGVDCELYENGTVLTINVSDENNSFDIPAGAFCITSVKYMKSDEETVIDFKGKEAILGLSYRRVPLFNRVYLAHLENDLKSRYLDKVCVFFDYTQIRLRENMEVPGFIGKVKEIEVNGDVSIIDDGKEFFANARIICEDVELECDILNLCILEAEYAPRSMVKFESKDKSASPDVDDMKDIDKINGDKLPDVSAYYEIDRDFNIYDWDYANTVLTPELEVSLNKYLANKQCFMVDTLSKTRGNILPQKFYVECWLEDDHGEIDIRVCADGHSFEIPAGALGMTAEKHMKSGEDAMIDIDGEEVRLGLTYRRVPLLNSLYLEHVESDLKSRYLGKVCVFFDHTQSRFCESGENPGYIGLVKEIEINRDLRKVDEVEINGEIRKFDDGEMLFVNVRIVCENVELECDLYNLCILVADDAPKKVDRPDWSDLGDWADWSEDSDEDFESESLDEDDDL